MACVRIDMKQHKWHKEIKAWADGAEIQFKDANDNNEWLDCTDNEPTWEILDFLEYRIKPQPKEPQYLYVFKGYSNELKVSEKLHQFEHQGMYLGKIKLEVEE